MVTFIQKIKYFFFKMILENFASKKYYDFTHLLSPDTPVFPGDPSFKIETIKKIEKDP